MAFKVMLMLSKVKVAPLSADCQSALNVSGLELVQSMALIVMSPDVNFLIFLELL